MGYKTTRDVEYDGKKYPAGKAIPIGGDADAADMLLALGAIEDTAEAADGPAKPLAKMTKPELLAVAAERGVAVAKKDDGTEIPVADATNTQILLAINSAADQGA